jgi:methionyl-tRNA synthetase
MDVIFTMAPTPNGALHIGHVSGPYLRADLNRRLSSALGCRTVHSSHIDNYQTYVAKKAREFGRDTTEFRNEMTSLIENDFREFGIELDYVVDNTDDHYCTFLDGCLEELFADNRALRLPEFVGRDARYSAVEGYVSGTCPACLHRAFVNICENCGIPLDLTRILNPVEESTGSSDFAEVDDSPLPTVLSIDEDDLHWLRERHRDIVSDNPFVAALIDDVDPHFATLTFRGDYGYVVAPGRVVNPFIEIFFAHVYSLGQLLGMPTNMTLDELRSALSAGTRPQVTFYFGSDNSYYYSVLYPLLANILRIPEMVPIALKANRFLKLNGRKVSSSRNNVIWARELASKYPRRLLRGALASSCPEFAELNFSEQLLTEALSWPAPDATSGPTFDSPETLMGKHFRANLVKIARPERFSVGELFNRVGKAVEFAESDCGSADERAELLGMVRYLRAILDL